MIKKRGYWWLVISGLLFCFYCLNVVVGKVALLSNNIPFFSMGDVGEFIVLFTAVIFFVVAMLEREAQLEG
ncbi:MAG: hypothetical protein ACI9CO_001872 [Candidatus Azotimanducaceae bacterium]|jgi:hypothetical protein